MEMFHIALIIGAFLMVVFIGYKKTELAVVVAIATFTFMILYSYCTEKDSQKTTKNFHMLRGEGE